jgi:hypothetical protein
MQNSFYYYYSNIGLKSCKIPGFHLYILTQVCWTYLPYLLTYSHWGNYWDGMVQIQKSRISCQIFINYSWTICCSGESLRRSWLIKKVSLLEPPMLFWHLGVCLPNLDLNALLIHVYNLHQMYSVCIRIKNTILPDK